MHRQADVLRRRRCLKIKLRLIDENAVLQTPLLQRRQQQLREVVVNFRCRGRVAGRPAAPSGGLLKANQLRPVCLDLSRQPSCAGREIGRFDSAVHRFRVDLEGIQVEGGCEADDVGAKVDVAAHHGDVTTGSRGCRSGNGHRCGYKDKDKRDTSGHRNLLGRLLPLLNAAVRQRYREVNENAAVQPKG